MKKTELYPLQFVPQYEYRLWGGDKLNAILNRDIEGNKIGESWEISAVEGAPSIVADGPFKGLSLPELIERNPEALLGKTVVEQHGKNFPLLIKFIDAKIPLSVQVHPKDELAKERHNSLGKNEMWYIIEAEKEAVLIRSTWGRL
jgi:mannose-6-phosphate isomerase